ncbi:LuxR C-terminal-related transcriptional regulator [Paenibacillus periandrae]|uniref:LuxR C-terminal-related transcriptional regulator n=1 Tax=Paenibacillus periandrae TaxID=1761741 RepID=UPI001F09E267|nr:LuxR C-terminal-related transcriptional regulator [Paenibacillus periandrae]
MMNSYTSLENASLTKEELLIMHMIIKGYKQDQVAEKIYASKRSVDNYFKKIYTKLKINSRLEAIKAFVKSDHYDENFIMEN